jgi:hypothetical protein
MRTGWSRWSTLGRLVTADEHPRHLGRYVRVWCTAVMGGTEASLVNHLKGTLRLLAKMGLLDTPLMVASRDMVNNRLWCREFIKGATLDHGSSHKVKKVIAALEITSGTYTNSWKRTGVHQIGRRLILLCLAVCAK